MAKQYVIIGEEGCPGCDVIKAELPDVKYIDVAKNKAAEQMADELGIDFVPTVVEVDKEHGKICILDENGKIVKCSKNKKYFSIF